MLKKILIILFAFLFISSCLIVGKYEESRSALNKIIKDLSFFPLNAPRFRLSDLKDKKAIVIVMRESGCPISEKYGPRIAQLEKQYPKDVQFIYNYVGQIQPEKSAQKELKKFGFKGPYTIDSRQKTINALKAKTTGDVFILTSNRRLVYRGPLDDQYHLLKSAIKPKNNYVSDRLKDLISGKKLTPKELPAPGCVISRPVVKKKSFIGM